MKIKKLYNRKGITLIEIMVSMGILVLIVAIVQVVFSVALRSWRKSDNLLQNAAIARTVLEQISREISSAVVEPGAGINLFGYNNPSGMRTNSVADEIYFIASVKLNNNEGTDLCEVGYWLDNINSLRRFYVVDKRGSGNAEINFDFSTGASYEFAENVTDLQIEYFDKSNLNSSVLSWDSSIKAEPPAMIKITITVATGKGTSATNPDFITSDYSTVVYLPQ